MRSGRIIVLLILALALLSAGCATPYVSAQKQYFEGQPALAEQTLEPKAMEAIKKDSRDKNLYAWDLGIYRFAQGDYDGAIDIFMKGVQDAEELASAGQTVGAAFSSASSQKYVGDPVEVSVAYMYIGLCYFMKGDYMNALIGFRRSLEEDLSKDEARHGDMGFTNYMMGETFLQTGQYDDAAVAFRRAIEHQGDLMPAYIGLYYALDKMGSTSDLAAIETKLDAGLEETVRKVWKKYPGQGITVAIFSGKASQVKKDAFLGAFRQRVESKSSVRRWRFAVEPQPGSCAAYFSDSMHQHFKDQGGLGDEVRKQTTRAVVGAGLKALFGVGTSTDADVRYWVTMPEYIYIGYVPEPPGTYSLDLEGLGNNDKILSRYTHRYEGIKVAEGRRTLVVITSFGTVSTSVIE